jgi:hypothetical protein
MAAMNMTLARYHSVPGRCAALFAIVACAVAGTCGAEPTLAQSRPGDVLLAQTTDQNKAPPATGSQPADAIHAPLAWTFGKPPPPKGESWTAERGTLTLGEGEARLQPDANRRVVLVSPPGLPDTARLAEEFVLGISGTGLQRVRIQARRDARGGWITIAEASGNALREMPGGYAVKRNPGARDARIERLRVEMQFRTTNPRELQSIAAH